MTGVDAPVLTETTTPEPGNNEPGPGSPNRAQRRAAARAARKQPQAPVGPRSAGLYEREQEAAQQAQMVLFDTIARNRWDAVNRALSALFTQDPGDDGVFRLGGFGGATGVVTADRLNEVVNAAVTAGMLLPGANVQEAEPDYAEGEGGIELAAEPTTEPAPEMEDTI